MENPELDLAYEFVQFTNKNIFLTGKAGTGKTTFLQSLKTRSHKRMVVLAPTGVAAINAGGQTIHSLFQLPFGPVLTERVTGQKVVNPNFKQKFNRRKIQIIKSLDLLVIDEISMVRADVLDAIDDVLRRYRDRFRPFGGVQLLMIGDLQQLAPVVKEDEWSILRPYYPSMYFFNSKALSQTNMVSVELKHVYRQAEGKFLDILNEVRDNRLLQESYELLHQRYEPGFDPKEEEGYIRLTTHNAMADRINGEKMKKLKGKSHIFTAEVKGNFSEYSYPTDFELELKKKAQVMFVKNDSSPEKRYYNGKIGRIRGFEDGIVLVDAGDGELIEVGTETWENVKYSINEKTKEITEEIVGSFEQVPLRLAWAITIHKSQGLTFDKAIIDAAAAFAHGQTYVALSRCRTLEGLVLSSRISRSAIICDAEVSGFNRQLAEQHPDKQKLQQAKYEYQFELLADLFNFKALAYYLTALEKYLWEQARAATGNLKDKLTEINKTAIPELNKVSAGFIVQMQSILKENPDAEKNTHLQERIQKASEYFYKTLEQNVIIELTTASFDSDNKEVKKAVQERLQRIDEVLQVKQKCLDHCKSGFELQSYLRVKAKAAIEDEKKKTKIRIKAADTKHPELYKMLKFWREAEAEMRLVPLFQVASNKMLQGIADNLPTDIDQLKKIKGVGKKTLKNFGDELIDMVKEYMVENGIEIPQQEIVEVVDEAEKPKKKRKKSNRKRALELYLGGMEIPEIVKELGLAESTVAGYFAKFVAEGEVNVDELVDAGLVDEVSDYLDEHPEASLTEIRKALDSDADWDELRYVRKHWERKNG